MVELLKKGRIPSSSFLCLRIDYFCRGQWISNKGFNSFKSKPSNRKCDVSVFYTTSFHIINICKRRHECSSYWNWNSALPEPKMCPNFLDFDRDMQFVLIELDSLLHLISILREFCCVLALYWHTQVYRRTWQLHITFFRSTHLWLSETHWGLIIGLALLAWFIKWFELTLHLNWAMSTSLLYWADGRHSQSKNDCPYQTAKVPTYSL